MQAAAKVRGCPPEDDIWMRLIHLLMPKPGVGSHGIFIDIGSNKGFTAARWFQLWNPEMGMSPPTLSSLLKQVSSDKQVRECGACGDCHDDKEPFTDLGLRLCGEASMKTANGNYRPRLEKAIASVCSRRLHNYRPIRVYSFDGNQVLVDAVNAAKTRFAKEGRHLDKQYLEAYVRPDAAALFESYWTVELAAFSDTYVPGATMTFIQNGELGHIVSDVVSEGDRPEANREGKTVKVPVLTVDQLVARDDIKHVDFLKIDTEGHDMTVLQGAKDTIAKRAVTVIMFEFNEFWPRSAPSSYHSALEFVIKDLLAPHDYICYLEGKNVMVRLTHCWDPAMNRLKQVSVVLHYRESIRTDDCFFTVVKRVVCTGPEPCWPSHSLSL